MESSGRTCGLCGASGGGREGGREGMLERGNVRGRDMCCREEGGKAIYIASNVNCNAF